MVSTIVEKDYIMVDQKKLQILKCSDSMMWYRDMVGETVVLARPANYDPEVYWSREPAGYINIIHKADAQLITMENKDGTT